MTIIRFRDSTRRPNILAVENLWSKTRRTLFAIIGCLFFLLLGWTKITNYDIWYHLATGRYILANGFPASDPFTYTQPEAPMQLLSWLPGVLYYGVWTIAGVEGLSVLKAILSVGLFAFLWYVLYNSHRSHRAVFLVGGIIFLLGAFAIKFRLFLRPHFLALFFLAAAILAMSRLRWRTGPLTVALVLITIPWVNTHGSFAILLFLPSLFLVCDWIDSLTGGAGEFDLQQALTAALVSTLAIVAASLLNPHGWRGLVAPFEQMVSPQELATLGEYQPLKLQHLATSTFLGYTWAFSALAIVGLAGLLAWLIRDRRQPLWQVALFLIFLTLPFIGGLRFIAEFVVVALPITVTWWLAVLPSSVSRPRSQSAGELALLLAAIPLWWILVGGNPIYQVGWGEKEGKFPEQATEFLETAEPTGPLFNSLGFGGYLIWNWPDEKVFIDGRMSVYPQDFVKLFRRAHFDPDAWKEIDRTWAPQIVILEYLTDYSGRENMPVVEASPEWALVFWDPVAKIYLRRSGPNEGLIDQFEYRWALPRRFNLAHLNEAASKAQFGTQAIQEFDRAVMDNDRNAEAHLGRAYLEAFGQEPDWKSALASADRALDLRPGQASAYAIRCRAHLGLGEMEAAARECGWASGLSPNDPVVRWANRILLNEQSTVR